MLETINLMIEENISVRVRECKFLGTIIDVGKPNKETSYQLDNK